LLKNSKTLDVFPTPVSEIVSYSNLTIDSDIDISNAHDSFLAKYLNKDTLKNALAKIRGVLDRSEKKIYLDLKQLPGRQNFVKLHEVGHEVLPWQKKALSYLDDDDTLGDHANEDFEEEANYFASVTLFQNDRFINKASTLEMNINTPLYLATHFGASIHATIRRYVESSPKRCALIILENGTHRPLPASCEVRNFICSPKFFKEFGRIVFPDKLGYKWAFVPHYYFERKMAKGIVKLDTLQGEVDFKYEFFYNRYNAFVLLYPQGESNKTRTQIILSQ
jgi:hypothetical protein